MSFVLVNVFLAPILFALGGFPLSFVLRTLSGNGLFDGPGFGIGIGSLGLLALPLAAFFAGAIPRVACGWRRSRRRSATGSSAPTASRSPSNG